MEDTEKDTAPLALLSPRSPRSPLPLPSKEKGEKRRGAEGAQEEDVKECAQLGGHSQQYRTSGGKEVNLVGGRNSDS